MNRPPHATAGAEARLAENPFFVLGLDPEVSRAEVERTGTRLLGMLNVGIAAASTYSTPVGPRQRTEELVRGAMAELRDPERRILHELWARTPTAPPTAEPALPPWTDAAERLRCSRR